MTDMSDYQLLQVRKRQLLEDLRDVNKIIDKGSAEMDIHHPRVPRYSHQEYPKMLYHPIRYDQAIESQRKGVELRNKANPNLAPLELPHQRPLTRIVNTAEEEKIVREEGFVLTPPFVVGRITEEESEAQESARDPLAASVPKEERKRKSA